MDDITASIIVACQTKGAQSALGGLGDAISKVGFAAGMLAKEMVSFGADCIKAFTVQEDAVDALNDALQLKGAGQYSQQLQTLASDLQKVTTYGDEATMAAMAQGVNMGISADQIGDATKAAMGLAAAYKMDLNSAMTLVARASQGQTQMLARYGIALDESLSPQEKFNALLQKGKDYFPLTEADTLSAKLKQMGNAWGDLKEGVGQVVSSFFGFDGAAESATSAITNITQYINDHIETWKVYFAGFRQMVSNVWDNICTFATNAFRSLKEEVDRVVAAIFGFDTASGAASSAITKITQYISEHIETWKAYFAGFRQVVLNVFENICAFAHNAWEVLKLAWQRAPEFWGAVWEDIKQTTNNTFELLRVQFVESFKMIWKVLYSFNENWWSVFKDIADIAWRSIKSVAVGFYEGIKQIGHLLGSLGMNFWDLITGKKTFSEAIGGVVDQFITGIKEVKNKVGEQWEGFEFGAGTKKFAKDTADAAKGYATAVAGAAKNIYENLGKNTSKFVKDNANIKGYKSVFDGVSDAMDNANKSGYKGVFDGVADAMEKAKKDAKKTKKTIAEIPNIKTEKETAKLPRETEVAIKETAKLPAIRETAVSAVSAKSVEGIKMMSRNYTGQSMKNEGISLDKKRNTTLDRIDKGIQKIASFGIADGYSYGD